MVPQTSAYAAELEVVLPAGLPNRAAVIDLTSRHLHRIAEINQFLNLTRVVEPREAALKHVLDSLLPWERVAGHATVLDIGTGAGFPGIPLAAAFPEQRFALVESIKKKANFVSDTVRELGLTNVEVLPERAEEVLRTRRFSLTLARAVAPLPKFLQLLRPVLRNCGTVLLYKGPDAEQEIAEAAAELKKCRLTAEVLRYELPMGAGSRTLIQLG